MFACFSTVAYAADANKVNFDKHIRPLLQKHCVDCHGPDTQDGGIRWDRRRSAMRGGDSGVPSIVPGNIAKSELIARLTTDDEDLRMPAEEDPLPPETIALVRKWIEQGADWPDDGSDSGPKHWSYVAPQKSELPKVKQAKWPTNAIDHFVLARLEAEKLTPSPAAERARLLRRVYLDLIGLPPTVAEVDAFLADKTPEAYEKVVDRLLASPHYGEHWARPWLDLARYADSNGYQRDGFKTMWAYRDWVIAALNKDMPFDQFTIEQIAGDLLPKATIEQRIATGFHRCPTLNVEAGVNQEENRTNQVFDRVNTTGTVWLGISLECAQCHNHKYDPISQREYYQIYAFFNNTPIETRFRNAQKDTAAVDFIDGPSIAVPLDASAGGDYEKLAAEYAKLEQQWKAQRTIAAKGFSAWSEKLTKSVSQRTPWKVLDVKSFATKSAAKHEILKDGSVLLSGKLTDKDTYTVMVETDLKNITALRIDALRHPTLPKNGPGRRAERPNFVLTELTVAEHTAKDAKTRPLVLKNAQANYHAKKFHPARAVDGNDATGWAIHSQFGKSHWATFQLAKPTSSQEHTRLTFVLKQNYGEQRTIGRLRLSAMTGDAAAASLPEYIVRVLKVPERQRKAGQVDALREFYLGRDPELQKMVAAMTKLKARMEDMGKGKGKKQSTKTLVMVELDQPRMTNLLKRGNWETKGITVMPDVPEELHPFPKDAPRNRLGFAKWLVDRENPLVARVTVNRWWQEFFGHGLVVSSEDFGMQGETPSHPQLLDWLAVEFMERDWSTKHIHKLIVMSSTYRQDSRVTTALLAKDPNNTLYARGPRFRLAAETIRDNALAISGLLSRKMGGPPVFPPQPANVWNVVGKVDNTYRTSKGEDAYRRGIYTIWRRSSPYPSFVNFDAPDRSTCVVKRPRTNTPLMALTLMNDPVFVEMSQALADRIANEANGDVRAKTTTAFRMAVSRTPKPDELNTLTSIYSRERERCIADPQSTKVKIGNRKLPAGVAAADWAAWYYVATVLLNLDETINKN